MYDRPHNQQEIILCLALPFRHVNTVKFNLNLICIVIITYDKDYSLHNVSNYIILHVIVTLIKRYQDPYTQKNYFMPNTAQTTGNISFSSLAQSRPHYVIITKSKSNRYCYSHTGLVTKVP